MPTLIVYFSSRPLHNSHANILYTASPMDLVAVAAGESPANISALFQQL